VFGSREEALANFSSKAPFDRLHPDVLIAYVDNGFSPTTPGEAEIRLRCRRSDEALVYAHGFSHEAFGRLGRVRCPVILADGAETDAVGADFLQLMAGRLPGAQVEVLAGLGHFGPMEDPDQLALSVLSSMSPAR
jgi:pimeloyl-ACP methyl ester carboxylesterase